MIDDADPETEYLKELFWQELFAALDELPPNQKQVFIWNELEDKTLQQIADLTGENLKTIISRKGYAVKYLRKRLENLYNEFLDFLTWNICTVIHKSRAGAGRRENYGLLVFSVGTTGAGRDRSVFIE